VVAVVDIKLSGAGETNPYGGQADSNVLTAREGWGGQPGHGPGGQRSHKPSQRGPATVVGIRIAGTTELNRRAALGSQRVCL